MLGHVSATPVESTSLWLQTNPARTHTPSTETSTPQTSTPHTLPALSLAMLPEAGSELHARRRSQNKRAAPAGAGGPEARPAVPACEGYQGGGPAQGQHEAGHLSLRSVQSINQSISQSVNQSINPSIHQSIHQSINHFQHCAGCVQGVPEFCTSMSLCPELGVPNGGPCSVGAQRGQGVEQTKARTGSGAGSL